MGFAASDLVLLSSTHYNFQLPSQKSSPLYLGPLKTLQIQQPNTVLIEVLPCLCKIQAIQNVQILKPYISLPPKVGPMVLPRFQTWLIDVKSMHRKES